MNKATQVVVGLALFGTLMGSRAMANNGRVHHGPPEACKADIEKFCAGKQKKEQWDCVQKNKSQFSKSCKEVMSNHERPEESGSGTAQPENK